MKASPSFVLKVFGVSGAIAVAIKTLGPRLDIPASVSASLAIVFLPTIVMAGVLAWQLKTPR